MYLNEEIQNKWKPLLEHEDMPAIKDAHRRSVTAIVLENTEKALAEQARAGEMVSLLETSGSATHLQ